MCSCLTLVSFSISFRGLVFKASQHEASYMYRFRFGCFDLCLGISSSANGREDQI